MQTFKTFKSDNYSGVHSEVMAALNQANVAHATAYMQDEYTAEANKLLQDHFAEDCKIIYCFNGTAANVFALRACLRPYQAVICPDSSHLHNNETGAPESILGCKLVLLPSNNGKITAEQISAQMAIGNGIHSPQNKVVSIAQSTEFGTVYTVEELKAIKKVCVEHNLYLHMDGCRIYNASAFLGTSFKAMTTEVGVDILSLGGTKNGTMMAEAVLVFNPELKEGIEYLQKNTLQLYSKNRYIAVQFTALFSNELWRRNAGNANRMAQLIAKKLSSFPQLSLMYPSESNLLFVQMPLELCRILEEKNYCYIWTEQPAVIRLVCSFDSTEEDVNQLFQIIEDYFRK